MIDVFLATGEVGGQQHYGQRGKRCNEDGPQQAFFLDHRAATHVLRLEEGSEASAKALAVLRDGATQAI
ncbi:MAG: hypothetical protein M3Q12_09105 [Pseudomonadota bacterium]|nr:hypothetical protein [Pseudomonadota bacterium]